MIKITISLLILTTLLSTCAKVVDDINYDCKFDTSVKSFGSAIDAGLSDNYFQIWKTLLKKKNNMSDEDFNQHIIQSAVSSNSWNGGISFRVDYILKIDWINVKCSDQFAIKMSSSYSPYQHLNIPRDVFLNQAEIENNITYNADSEISTYNLNGKLKYANCTEVIRAAKSMSGYKNISPDYLSFYVPGNVPRENGDPYMMVNGKINESENKCLTGNINLFTGECNIRETACIIYFCFKEGTQITINNGLTRSIEKIKTGDSVLSVNINTLKVEKDIVQQIDSVVHNSMVHIVFSDMSGNDNTFDHPYYVKNKGWCSYRPLETLQKYNIGAKQLQTGDICYKYQNNKLEEVCIISMKENSGDIMTYNISRLKKNQNYFANGILVSNESNKFKYKFLTTIK